MFWFIVGIAVGAIFHKYVNMAFDWAIAKIKSLLKKKA